MTQKLDFTTKERRRLVGRRIRRHRLALARTQAQLARSLGLSPQQIQKYELGMAAIAPPRLREIAYVLGVPPEELTPKSGPTRAAAAFARFVESPEAMLLHRAMTALPDDEARRRLTAALLVFCESQIRPEDAGGGTLPDWLKAVVLTGDGADSERIGADIRQMKSQLAERIGAILKARRWTQKHSAEFLRVHQARISAFARGDVRALSFEKLLRHAAMLGWSISLTITRQTIDQPARIELRGPHVTAPQ